MSLLTILLIVVALIFLLGGLPSLGYHQYGWGPSGIGLVLIIILVILLVSGRL